MHCIADPCIQNIAAHNDYMIPLVAIMLVAMFAFFYIILAIITVFISDLLAVDNLQVFYIECHEHGLERYITRLLCGILDVHF